MRDVILAFLSPPNPNSASGKTMQSAISAAIYDASTPLDAHRGRFLGVMHQESGPLLGESRDDVVRTFLGTEAEWLVMFDADVVFEQHAIHWLLDCADPVERPIVSGLCFAGDGARLRPVLIRLEPVGDGFVGQPIHEYPEDQLVQVDAVGAGFVVFHRSVFERIGDDGWFSRNIADGLGRPLPEDLALCVRAQALGIPVHAHTGIRVGHHKSVVLTESMYREGVAPSLPVASAG